MPYTPPSSLTPTQRPRLATAGPSSVSHGRHNSEPVLTTSVRSHQPKTFPSSSYIHRHRRSPTVCAQVSLLNGSGQPKSSRSNSLPSDDARASNPSLWRTALQNNTLIPNGAVISPPDSKSNSSDEEGEVSPNEKQDLRLAELEAAILSIDPEALQPSVSKESNGKETSKSNKPSAPFELSLALATKVHENGQKSPKKIRPKLQNANSSDSIILAHSSEIATHTPDDSDHDDEIEIVKKPVMVRKKSGELVRPALRPSHKRPSSVPGTPTFVKAVHFDSHLEHIRHFLQVDKPLAVSAGSSPVGGYEGDTEFPFGFEDRSSTRQFEWEARIANFPPETEARRKAPVRLERIFLSSDNKRLIGVVAVANIAFNKHVVARFTLDYWRTTSEVVAEYNNDVRRKQAQDGYDRFNFSILLADQGNLESKRMFVCVRYNVSGLEFWDNNSSMNYHIDFVKKEKKPQHTASTSHGLGARPVAAIPRSKSPNGTAPRPLSMPPLSSGDFFFDPPRKLTGSDDREVSPWPLKMASSGDDDMIPDAPTRRSKPAPQAFGNRYDFGASLSAAVQSGSAGQTRRGLPVDATRKPEPNGYPTKAAVGGNKEPFTPSAGEPSGLLSPVRSSSPSGSSRPADLVSGKPYHQSPVYKELVDKYCFYGSSKPAAQDSTKHPRHQQNMKVSISNNDGAASPIESTSSEESSPIGETPPRIKPLSLPVSPAPSPSTPSPVPFSHSYHQVIQNTILPESPTPTVIRG